jgi:ABC-type dipeptide/oligopeptide/nickel transport system permease component
MLGVRREDYVQTARSEGLSNRLVLGAIGARHLPAVPGVVSFTASVIVAVDCAVDLLYAASDAAEPAPATPSPWPCSAAISWATASTRKRR